MTDSVKRAAFLLPRRTDRQGLAHSPLAVLRLAQFRIQPAIDPLVSQDELHVVPRFGEGDLLDEHLGRNRHVHVGPVLHAMRPGVVSGERQFRPARELLEELMEVAGPETDAHSRVVEPRSPVAHAFEPGESPSGGRHHLHQSARSDRRPGPRDEHRFLPDERRDQVGVELPFVGALLNPVYEAQRIEEPPPGIGQRLSGCGGVERRGAPERLDRGNVFVVVREQPAADRFERRIVGESTPGSGAGRVEGALAEPRGVELLDPRSLCRALDLLNRSRSRWGSLSGLASASSRPVSSKRSAAILP